VNERLHRFRSFAHVWLASQQGRSRSPVHRAAAAAVRPSPFTGRQWWPYTRSPSWWRPDLPTP